MLRLFGLQFWLCTQATDMRKSYDGLTALVANHLNADPLNGHVYVFINRRRTQMKCLYFESGGFCLWAKRLEQGRFAFSATQVAQKSALSPTEFSALIEGLDVAVMRRRKRYKMPKKMQKNDAFQGVF